MMAIKPFPTSPAMQVIIMILLLFTSKSNAFFRHLCQGEVGIGRIDPIVSEGKPSAHCHGIHGASNMGFETDYNHLLASNCTSCSARQDKSAYWSPYLYFRHANGTIQMVPKSGGLTVYYFTERPADQLHTPIVAFPPGFRMIAGSNFKRQWYNGTDKQVRPPNKKTWTQHDIEQQARLEYAIGFTCLNYHAPKNEDAIARHFMPERALIDANCTDGLRAEIMFPTCWNGELDSENHADHVAYPAMPRNGPCPPGYDKGRFPALFFETVYMTPFFRGMDGEFVFSNGDPTGNGYHGDFVNGWEDGVLQAAIDNEACTHGGSDGRQDDCPVLDLKPDSEIHSCKMQIPEILQAEPVNFVDILPGDIGIYRGPDFAPLPGKPGQPIPSLSTENVVIGTGTAIGGIASLPTSVYTSLTAPGPTSDNSSMDAPYYSASGSITAPTTLTTPMGIHGSKTTVDYNNIHIEGNHTVVSKVHEVVIFSTTTYTKTVPVATAIANATISMAKALPAGPVKRHLNNHGRVHA